MFALLLGILLTIMVGGQATTHVLEPIVAMSSVEAASAGHTAGDVDEVQADGDKGYPHHHAGCHDHVVSVPLTAERLADRLSGEPALSTMDQAALATSAPGSLLRPPKA